MFTKNIYILLCYFCQLFYGCGLVVWDHKIGNDDISIKSNRKGTSKETKLEKQAHIKG